MNIKYEVGFIGAGNMATSIASAVLSRGLLKPKNMIVSARSKASLASWENKGFNCTFHNCEVVSKCDIIFLAIKPQQFPAMVSSLHSDVDKSKIHKIVSVMAGVSIETIKQSLQPAIGKVEIIRVMPNTPLLVGHGCSVMCSSDEVDKNFELDVMDIMSASGTCDIVTENQVDAVTAVSASGPAYIYLAIEAIADGGVKCGLPRALALKLASQTVVGAGQMVIQTGQHPGLLKDQVCSPGGTTIHAVHALETSGVRAGFINAVEAAYKRATSFK